MGQIVRKKKKGRPSKADLARRAGESQANPQPDLRRSLRRRNARYNVDYDDYLDEYDEDEEEDERRREKKKLKLVVKLNQGQDEDESAPGLTRADARGDHAISASDDDESERKPLKKRRINDGRYISEEGGKEEQGEGEENEGDDCNEDEYENNHAQEDCVDAAAAVSVVEFVTLTLRILILKESSKAVSERARMCRPDPVLWEPKGLSESVQLS